MPTWPASLPQSPESAGYREGGGFPVIQAPVDGPPKSRRRYTAAIQSVPCSVRLTAAQLATFETFFRDDLQQGALAFDWSVRGDAARSARYRFTAEYQLTHLGGPNWQAELPLIRLP